MEKLSVDSTKSFIQDDQLRQAIIDDITLFDNHVNELSHYLVDLIKNKMDELGDELKYLRITPDSKMWSSLICYKKDLDLSHLYGDQDDWPDELKYNMEYMFKATNTNELGLAVGNKKCILFAFNTK